VNTQQMIGIIGLVLSVTLVIGGIIVMRIGWRRMKRSWPLLVRDFRQWRNSR